MNRRTASSIFGIFQGFGAAVAVSNAVREHRNPNARDLERLGIDPSHYRAIGR